MGLCTERNLCERARRHLNRVHVENWSKVLSPPPRPYRVGYEIEPAAGATPVRPTPPTPLPAGKGEKEAILGTSSNSESPAPNSPLPAPPAREKLR